MKDAKSYAVFSGIAIFILSMGFGLFLDWSLLNKYSIIIPLITGTISGITSWIYYRMISKEDISNMVGMIYIYPIIVAALSFFFLNEKLNIISYLGVIMTISGALLLTTKMRSLKKGMLIYIVSLITLVGINEFLIKVGTSQLPALNCAVISNSITGLILIGGLFNRKIRQNAKTDLKNFHIVAIIEPIYLAGNFFLFIAMAKMSATIVSSICAIQPLAVVFFEWIINKKFKITVNDSANHKFLSTTLIVSGIILMYLFRKF
jgi:drug/metabolite transporter (DMT)-like permease